MLHFIIDLRDLLIVPLDFEMYFLTSFMLKLSCIFGIGVIMKNQTSIV